MKKPKTPCTRECPKRTVGCRSTCPDGKRYEQEYAAWKEFIRNARKAEDDYEGVRMSHLKGRDPI